MNKNDAASGNSELLRQSLQDKKTAPGWERKILFLINSQPENAKELIFKMLDSLVKNIPVAK